VPVVHATGGLKDSVVQYNPFQDTDTGYGTGWKFDCADAEGLKFGLWNSLNTYRFTLIPSNPLLKTLDPKPYNL
jgi:starch synthase